MAPFEGPFFARRINEPWRANPRSTEQFAIDCDFGNTDFAAQPSSDALLSQAVGEITERVGRKAVLTTHSFSKKRALRIAEENNDRISDVIVLDAPHAPDGNGVRIHSVSFSWSPLFGVVELPRLLRDITIELIETPLKRAFRSRMSRAKPYLAKPSRLFG